MGRILGLDLGITSVGYGIIDDSSSEIVDYGVRLFDEGTADENKKRRGFRSGRRLKSRRINRVNAIKYLLVQEGIMTSFDQPLLNNEYKINLNNKAAYNIYEIKVKGLTQKLSNIELASILVNYAKRRGSSLEVAVDEDDLENVSFTNSLSKNTAELLMNNMYICEHQLKKLNETGKIRNTENTYKSLDYEKEIRKILSNQGLSDEINEKIIEIIFRRRPYSIGPGSEKFPTKYGSWRLDDKGNIYQVNLIEEMRGKCSIYKNEPRIAKFTYTASLFNFLNDLNNLTIDGGKISKEDKIEIVKIVNAKGKFTVKNLEKMYQGKKIEGFRIDKDSKPILTKFDGYIKLLGILPSDYLEDKDKADSIIEILTKTLIVEERKKELKVFDSNLSDDIVDKLSNLTKINGYHSLSKKAMKEIIPEMFERSLNQMQIIYENKIKEANSKEYGNEILFDDNAILSPVAKRVHIQALRVVNELRKKYGEFDSIVIETTRYKNSDEEKKELVKYQKKQEEDKKKADELLLEIDKDPSKFNANTRLKLIMYKQQNCKTMYAGLDIDLERLLNDPTAYQIEHIIPYAISFDNSLNNKALASAKENEDKGKRTPYSYIKSGKFLEINGPIKSFDEFEVIVNSLDISDIKKKNLLNREDINSYDNMEKFINRNLVDTSYGIRTVMNSMKLYFKEKNINTKVFTIKGKITNDFRKRVGIEKNRDEYIHHAIDALIIAFSKKQKVFNNAFDVESKRGITFYKDTGEIIDDNPLNDGEFIRFLKKLKSIKGSPEDFSWKVDKKTNRQFADQTICSTREINGEDYVIRKYKDIYGKDGESIKRMFEKNVAKKKLLVAKNDIETFLLLEKIYNEYKSEKNPFAKYKEENGVIRKYSKNGKGPEINCLKYIDGKLGDHMDISSHYQPSKNKKVVLLQNSSYRTDIYLSADGKYKMLTIKRHHVKQIGEKNVIEKELYDDLKQKKEISTNDKFLFSLNRYDIIDFVKEDDLNENISLEDTHKFYRFKCTNSDLQNIIEVAMIERNSERCKLIISSKVKKLEKYVVNPIGKWEKVNFERLKLEW